MYFSSFLCLNHITHLRLTLSSFHSYTPEIRRCTHILQAQVSIEKEKLDRQISIIKKQLKACPKGHFYCTKNRQYYKWNYTLNGKKIYIPKSRRELAEKLAYKRYLTTLLNDLQKERAAIGLYESQALPSIRNSDKLLITCPEYSKLLSKYFKPMNEELAEWMTEPYPQNNYFAEKKIHKSPSGNVLRSKSEAMIDSFLYLHRIPFRYEAPLKLSAKTIYPDFTIRHPRTGEYFYHEHFGMMDEPEYAASAASKLQLYISNNIIPSINLITTYETKEHPLDADTVNAIIKKYFL